MKVKELIEKLQTLPLDTEVECNCVFPKEEKISDNEFWKIVSTVNWKNICKEYEKPVQTAEEIVRRVYQDKGSSWAKAVLKKIKDKEQKLDSVFRELWLSDWRIGDDSYWDLKAHVVGCGKRAYYEALKNPEIVKSKYIDSTNRFRENFEYCFSHLTR